MSLVSNYNSFEGAEVNCSRKGVFLLFKVFFFTTLQCKFYSISTTPLFYFIFKGPSQLGVPGPRLRQMMNSEKLNASTSGESPGLNASIRERLRSKVRGRQVYLLENNNSLSCVHFKCFLFLYTCFCLVTILRLCLVLPLM